MIQQLLGDLCERPWNRVVLPTIVLLLWIHCHWVTGLVQCQTVTRADANVRIQHVASEQAEEAAAQCL